VVEIAEKGGNQFSAASEANVGNIKPVRRPIEQILIVDNDIEACLFLKSILEDLGYSWVDTTVDFEEGTRQAIERDYDLILMDLKKEDHDWAGMQAAEVIQTAKPDSLIVLVTGEDVFQGVLQDKKAYISGRIPKPLTVEAVDSALKSLEQTGHAGWPVILGKIETESVHFVDDISKVAKSHKPLFDILVQMLDKVLHATGAEREAVFRLDFVVMDQVMVDGIDGIEATRQINQIDPDIRTIVMTMYGDGESSQAALDAGAYRYVFRPSNPAGALKEIISLIDSADELMDIVQNMGRSAWVSDIYNGMGIAMGMVDRTYRVLHANPAQAEVAGGKPGTGGVCWVEWHQALDQKEPCP
jgi:DNA-binding NtrC family response regulator